MAPSQRITEAQVLFEPIVIILDRQCLTNNPHVPARHIKALSDLYEELTVVARRHFESFVRGVSASTGIKGGEPPALKNTLWKGDSPFSYAQAASSNIHSTQHESTSTNDRQTKNNLKRP